METTYIDNLLEKSAEKARDINTSFKRYLYDWIDWSDRLIVIKGARGVGKTTLLLQYMKENFAHSDEALYVSLDDLWFTDHKISDLADQFYKLGGKYLLMDEVHKYPGWSQEVKNMYDDYRDLHLILTSSSALNIYQARGDLSRRSVTYELRELSLREYLILKDNIGLPAYGLKEIIAGHQKISTEISKKIKPLKYLHEYYSFGCYPYFMENPENFHQRVQNTVNTILETDLPAILNIDYSSVHKLKKLLYVISTLAPFTPNIAKLSRKTGVARDTLLHYLQVLSEAHLICLLRSAKQGMSYLTKPEKIFLRNTTLVMAISGEKHKTGTLRETFFMNQVNAAGKVNKHLRSDFIVDDKFIFEVGGKNKTRKQIEGLSNAFIVSDDIEIGVKNRIPLWLFGFLY